MINIFAYKIGAFFRKNYKALKSFNSTERAYFFAQLFWLTAVVILMTLTPLLIKAVVGEASMTGFVRTMYMWTLTISLVFAGNTINYFSLRQMLISTSIAKCIIFGIMTLLLVFNALTLNIILLVFMIQAVITAHSHLLDMDIGGGNLVFQDADKRAKALYIFKFIDYFLMLLIPVAIGFFIDYRPRNVSLESALGGFYIVFLITMFCSIFIYFKYLKPVNISTPKKKSFLKGFVKNPSDMWVAARIIWHLPLLRLRVFMVIIESFIDDSFMMVILPTLALDILNTGALENGLLLGAFNAGGLLATTILLSDSAKIQRKYGFFRYVLCLGILSGLSFIPTILFWSFPFFPVMLLAVLLIKFLYEPLRCRMQFLIHLEINNSEEAKSKQAHIFSLVESINTLSCGLGTLVVSLIFVYSREGSLIYHYIGDYASLKIISILFFMFSTINIYSIYVMKKHIYNTNYFSEEKRKLLLETTNNFLMKKGIPCLVEEVRHKISNTQPTVVLLAPFTSDNLSILLEGGRQSPGNIHLVIEPSWIYSELQHDGTNRLFLKKGYYCDREGDLALAHYVQPRLINYFTNFFTAAIPSNKPATLLENKLAYPMGCDSFYERLINENLFMRLLLSTYNMNPLKTFAFLMSNNPLISNVPQTDKVMVKIYPRYSQRKREEIRDMLKPFLDSYLGNSVVVKPSGAGFIPPHGVIFFEKDKIEDIVEHILFLENDPLMNDQATILIEERVNSIPLYFRFGEDDNSGRYVIFEKRVSLKILTKQEIESAVAREKNDWVIHLCVARTPWNGCEIASCICRVGEFGMPLSVKSALIPWESVVSAIREQYNLFSNDPEGVNLLIQLEDYCETILKAIDEVLTLQPRNKEAPLDSQVDCLGLDLMLEYSNDTLTPRIIAIHDHNSGRQHQFDMLYPFQIGRHSEAWIANMLARAARNSCKYKRLVLLGAGNENMRIFIDRANELGIEVILVDGANSWAKNNVKEFIQIDSKQSDQRFRQAFSALEKSVKMSGAIDGITTFWDDDIVLTAELARAFNLPYLDVANARAVKNKFKTRKILTSYGLSAPRFFYIQDRYSLDIALREISNIEYTSGSSLFPMVLKPVSSASSKYTMKVENANEVRYFYNEFLKKPNLPIDVELDHQGKFILEEFFSGFEFDVDIVIQGGRVKYSSITDKWSDNSDLFINPERDSLPSWRLSQEKQLACINLSILALQALNINDGIMHIEGKYDENKRGAEILGINARPAGLYLTKWQKKVWGIDFPEILFALALQIPVHIYRSKTPLTHLEAYVINSNRTGIFKKWEGIAIIEQLPGFKEFCSLVKEGDRVIAEKGTIDQIAYVIAEGRNSEEALTRLNDILTKISFEIESP